ncbi:hypothetical protein F1C76_20340 [Geodermatophilaceae bacterium NBWT11]|nr:hypothetical protein F1C76_20340 [Geodermatophilaceae bacterium NBWT11]
MSAPPGAGKTVLMSGWADQRARAGDEVAWVSLDEGDDEPDRFWSGVLQAVGGSRSPSPPSPASELGPVVALESLTGDAPTPTWLFLDDLHEVADPRVLRGLDTLVRRPPRGLQLVVASRRDPPFAWHRLRLDGRLHEIRSSDLAFDRAAVVHVLAEHDVVLDPADVDLVLARTEGWAAGVRLAAMALTGVTDVHAAVARFAGDDHSVADYLTAEVLARMAPRPRAVLEVCAVPERLPSGLAPVLTGDPAAELVLDGLCRDNALLRRSTAADGGFHLHPLLRGHLVARLRLGDPVAHREAHRRAAEWFRERGAPVPAVIHAAQAGDDRQTVRLLAACGPALLATGRSAELRTLVRTAPVPVQEHPTVRLLDALVDDGATDAPPGPPLVPRPRDGRAASRVEEPVDGVVHEPIALLAALGRAHREPALAAPALAASAGPARDRADDVGLLLHLERGQVGYRSGQLDLAEQEFTAAAAIARRAANGHALVRASAGLAAAAGQRGRYRDAWTRADETLHCAHRFGLLGSTAVQFAVVIAARCARERLDPAAARGLTEVVVRRGVAEHPALRETAARLRAVLDVDAGGSPADAARWLQQGWTGSGDRTGVSSSAVDLAYHQHRYAWMAGRPTWAYAALVEVDRQGGPGGEAATLHALDNLHRGRRDAARRTVAPVLDGRTACRALPTRQLAWLVEALVASHAGQPARSHAAVLEALVLAEESGALRPFLDVPGIADLLIEDAGRFGQLEHLVERVRTAATTRGDRAPLALTPAELALLPDLPSQLTLQEIAARHQVSVNTVKTHVRSIYAKLGATSRREALVAARRCGLL